MRHFRSTPGTEVKRVMKTNAAEYERRCILRKESENSCLRRCFEASGTGVSANSATTKLNNYNYTVPEGIDDDTLTQIDKVKANPTRAAPRVA